MRGIPLKVIQELICKNPDPLLGIVESDPLFEWLGAGDALPETRFMARALNFMREADAPEFAHLFWQYMRIRNLTYRHLVLPPGIAGLDAKR